MPASKSPFDAVRDAFAELDASEKTAFVLEATFAAVGEGLAETGRRFSAAVSEIDDLFSAPSTRDAAPAAAPKAASKPRPRKAPAAKKRTTKKTPPGSGKTAGKPPKDDA